MEKLTLLTARTSDILRTALHNTIILFDDLNKNKKKICTYPERLKCRPPASVVNGGGNYGGYKFCWKNDDPVTTDVGKRIKFKTPYGVV